MEWNFQALKRRIADKRSLHKLVVDNLVWVKKGCKAVGWGRVSVITELADGDATSGDVDKKDADDIGTCSTLLSSWKHAREDQQSSTTRTQRTLRCRPEMLWGRAPSSTALDGAEDLANLNLGCGVTSAFAASSMR